MWKFLIWTPNLWSWDNLRKLQSFILMKIVWIIFQKWCLLSSQSSTFRISTLTQFSVIDFFPRFTIGVKDRIFKVDIFLKNMGQYNCMTADTMTSSPLIRLQRPLPPSGDAILNNENSLFWIGLFKQFLISFSKKKFLTSGSNFFYFRSD